MWRVLGGGWAAAGRRLGGISLIVQVQPFRAGRRLGGGWAAAGRRLGGGWAAAGRRLGGALPPRLQLLADGGVLSLEVPVVTNRGFDHTGRRLRIDVGQQVERVVTWMKQAQHIAQVTATELVRGRGGEDAVLGSWAVEPGYAEPRLTPSGMLVELRLARE
ncbi:MAG: hypothetical protein H6739_35470 [Alphaproteobacteria bacterium]|nr:hypothetical protein [Alphaproteobacteria bacterium]